MGADAMSWYASMARMSRIVTAVLSSDNPPATRAPSSLGHGTRKSSWRPEAVERGSPGLVKGQAPGLQRGARIIEMRAQLFEDLRALALLEGKSARNVAQEGLDVVHQPARAEVTSRTLALNDAQSASSSANSAWPACVIR